MTATGLSFPAIRPSLGRLAHIRAISLVRLTGFPGTRFHGVLRAAGVGLAGAG